MTGLLASVRSLPEADMALGCFADIIDCKDPRRGALGSLGRTIIRDIVDHVGGDRPVSATVGDIVNDTDELESAIKGVSDCGVDFIKFGLFDLGDVRRQLRLVEKLSNRHQLIAVGFADRFDPIPLIPLFAESGCRGLMIDTADKTSGSLTRLWSETKLREFVTGCEEHDLLCGLAGKLGIDDVDRLSPLSPDYLGFRSALCGGDRRKGLDYTAMMGVRVALPLQASVAPIPRFTGARH